VHAQPGGLPATELDGVVKIGMERSGGAEPLYACKHEQIQLYYWHNKHCFTAGTLWLAASVWADPKDTQQPACSAGLLRVAMQARRRARRRAGRGSRGKMPKTLNSRCEVWGPVFMVVAIENVVAVVATLLCVEEMLAVIVVVSCNHGCKSSIQLCA
jgi:hypothetical protein